jgi:bifunctional ADP-heptose synthase (sugar kinase/adenylyltransferase)
MLASTTATATAIDNDQLSSFKHRILPLQQQNNRLDPHQTQEQAQKSQQKQNRLLSYIKYLFFGKQNYLLSTYKSENLHKISPKLLLLKKQIKKPKILFLFSRLKLPAKMFDRSQISIWSILKQNIGKVR